MSKKKLQRHREIAAFIQEAKSVPCARCRVQYSSVCMDFDHLPEFPKLFNIGSPQNWTSLPRIKAEIAKCQVICSNCHRIVTWERKYGLTLEPDDRLPGREDRAVCAEQSGEVSGVQRLPGLRPVYFEEKQRTGLTDSDWWDTV